MSHLVAKGLGHPQLKKIVASASEFFRRVWSQSRNKSFYRIQQSLTKKRNNSLFRIAQQYLSKFGHRVGTERPPQAYLFKGL